MKETAMQKSMKSFDQNVLRKLKVLPQYQKKEVLDFLDFLVKKTETVVKPAKKLSRQKKKFKFDWEGGLADMQKDYTSVELQHKAVEWR
jgi:hypothetical protein